MGVVWCVVSDGREVSVVSDDDVWGGEGVGRDR